MIVISHYGVSLCRETLTLVINITAGVRATHKAISWHIWIPEGPVAQIDMPVAFRCNTPAVLELRISESHLAGGVTGCHSNSQGLLGS